MEVNTQAACSAHEELNGGQTACSAHEELNRGQSSGCM